MNLKNIIATPLTAAALLSAPRPVGGGGGCTTIGG